MAETRYKFDLCHMEKLCQDLVFVEGDERTIQALQATAEFLSAEASRRKRKTDHDFILEQCVKFSNNSAPYDRRHVVDAIYHYFCGEKKP